MAKESMIILYVTDQEKSKKFYETILNKEAILHVPGMTEFDLHQGFLLGLMPEKSIAKILASKTALPQEGNGIPRCELYLMVDDVKQAYENAIKAGAHDINGPEPRDWGDVVAYCADPDGHIIAFAK